MGANGSRVDAQDPDGELGFAPGETAEGQHPRSAPLYFFDSNSNKWLQQSVMVVPEFSKVEEDEDDMKAGWYMEVSGFFDVRISVDLRLLVDRTSSTFHFYADGSRCLKFYSSEGFEITNRRFDDCIFENNFGLVANDENKKKTFEKDTYNAWLLGEDPVESFFDLDEAEDKYEPKHSSIREVNSGHDGETEAHQLEMGGLDNSFVIRDGGVEVYRNIDENGETFKKAGVNVKLNYKGNVMTPQKALLADRETNMLFMTPDASKKSSIFRMDLEREQVVSEWNFRKDGVDIPMSDIATDFKSAQMEGCSTFLGLDSNRLCRWDTRVARGMVQETDISLDYSTGKDYAVSSKCQFRCMATTGEGHVALGSLDGRIRLYTDRSLTKAKTAFPGLGSPITSIDVSFDGKWVLATTDTYILVISTACRNTKGEITTGFKQSMGKNMTAPRLLKLLPADVAKTNNANFAKAKFTWITEQGAQERLIVVSCGTYSVLWNFRRVKSATMPGANTPTAQGMKVCFDYDLSSKKEETVVESSFMHDRFNSVCSNMVVATKHEVYSLAGMDTD